MRWAKQVAQSVRRRQQVAGLSESAEALQLWFKSAAGQRILAREQQEIDKALNCLFGYHLLQMSALPDSKLYESSRICHCCRVSFDVRYNGELTSHFESLPLADESVDVTLVHHALDFSENPHQLLSEVSRVTIAHGHIVIVGFDPVSLTGAIKPIAQLANASPFWLRHSLSCNRISDWLKLLGFETKETQLGYSLTPLFSPRKGRLGNKLHQHTQLPFGHFYCIVARKTVANMRPIKPAWDAQLLGSVKGVKIAPRPITAKGAARLSLIRKLTPKRSPRD
ncbi:MAG TPA: methyltransferase domain-containing protein [Marinagarivorans sp.]